jgi:F0F1-type ATP synthase epsilon subunit
MFEDQKIELLPARTTMKRGGLTVVNQSFNYAEAVAVNAGNVNVGGDQANIAVAAALAGSNVFIGG